MLCKWRKEFSEAASSVALMLARINSEYVKLLLLLSQILYSNILYGAATYLIVTLLIMNPGIPTETLFWLHRNLHRMRFYLGRISDRFRRFFTRMTNIRISYEVSRNLRIYGGHAVVLSIRFYHIFNIYRLYFLRTEGAALHSRICYVTSIIFEMIFLSFSPILYNARIRYRVNWFTLGIVPGLILLRFPDLWNRTYFIHAVISYTSLARQYWNMLIPFRVHERFNNADARLMPFLILRPYANIAEVARIWENTRAPEDEEHHEH